MMEWENGETNKDPLTIIGAGHNPIPSKLCSYKEAQQYKYGIEWSRDFEHTMKLDPINKNTLWKDAVRPELNQNNKCKVVDH